MNIDASILLADRLLHALAVRAILPGRFHADVCTIVVQQPAFKLQDGVVEGREAFLLIVRCNSLGCDDSGD